MWEERSCSWAAWIEGLWPGHMPHTGELWGWSRDRHVCVCFESRSGFLGRLVIVEEGWEFVDAHHMGSCGPLASVGGWAPAGTGLCCNRSDPWWPAAAVVEPAVWRSSSSPPSDWTSPLQERIGNTITANVITKSESAECNCSHTQYSHQTQTEQKGVAEQGKTTDESIKSSDMFLPCRVALMIPGNLTWIWVSLLHNKDLIILIKTKWSRVLVGELQEPPNTCLGFPWKPKEVFPVASPTVCFTNTALG